jgi:hypothetical protein
MNANGFGFAVVLLPFGVIVVGAIGYARLVTLATELMTRVLA